MGNPAIRHPSSQGAAEPQPATSNGILAQIPGDHISAGSLQLPPAAMADKTAPVRQVDLHVPGQGLVRITYQLNTYRHRRSMLTHWLAVRADRL